MKNIELYDRTKTYYFRTGAAATPEVVAVQYPMVAKLPCVIETDPSHTIFGGFNLLAELRAQYGIPDTTTDEEAVEIIAKRG